MAPRRAMALFVLTASTGAAIALGCVGDDPFTPEVEGSVGQRCFPNGTCNTGLDCKEGRCEARDDGTRPTVDGGGPSADAVADAPVAGDWKLVFEGFGVGWQPFTTGSGTTAVDGGLLHAKTTGTPGVAYLLRQSPSVLTYGELLLKVVVQPIAFGAPFPCVLTLQPGPSLRPSLRLQPTPPGAGAPSLHHELVDGGFEEHAFTAQLTPGKPTALQLEVRFGASAHAVLSYDGTMVLDVPLSESLPIIDRPEVGVGVTCDETNAELLVSNPALYFR